MREFTPEQEAWIATRPLAVQEKIRAYPPDQTYRVKSTGQLAQIDSYSEGEDGGCETCCVTVWYEYLPIPHGVFGMHFTDLEIIPPLGERVHDSTNAEKST